MVSVLLPGRRSTAIVIHVPQRRQDRSQQVGPGVGPQQTIAFRDSVQAEREASSSTEVGVGVVVVIVMAVVMTVLAAMIL